jgi:hypothetical protein
MRNIDLDQVREQDNDNTDAAKIREYLAKASPEAMMRLAVYAVANAGDPKEHRSTAASYDSEVDHAAKLEADAIITRIWADMWEDRKDAAAQHKFDSRD